MEASALDWALKRDRRLVVVGLIVAVVLAWIYLLTGAGMSMDGPTTWTLPYFLLVLVNIARPAIANERLSLTGQGNVRYRSGADILGPRSRRTTFGS